MSTSKPSASVPGDKEKLVDWRADPADMTLQNLDTWYLGGEVHTVPRKGELAAGSDADIVIFDPGETHTLSVNTHHMNVDYSAYEGWELTGKVKTVILRGQVAIDNGKCLVQKGYGKFIKRNKVSIV